jgi:hypothetical protein
MDRRTRNRIMRWMNDHHIHYTNAMGLAEGCAEGPRPLRTEQPLLR